jgi:hypothetical protein
MQTISWPIVGSDEIQNIPILFYFDDKKTSQRRVLKAVMRLHLTGRETGYAQWEKRSAPELQHRTCIRTPPTTNACVISEGAVTSSWLFTRAAAIRGNEELGVRERTERKHQMSV